MKTTSLLLWLILSAPAFSQELESQGPASPSNDVQMATPPPVSTQDYPMEVGAETKSNYIAGAMIFRTAYIDNLYPGNGTKPIGETTYSVFPAVELDQTTSLRHARLSFSPGFTFYQPTSALNQVDESAYALYKVRLSPHSVLNMDDRFSYSSTSFGSVASGGGRSVTGSAQSVTPGIMAPFAKQLVNDASAEYTLQTSLSSMVGASGTSKTLHYPNLSEVNGLYDSNSWDASGFYNRRLSRRQYSGITYAYSNIRESPPNAESTTTLHGIGAFYSLYPNAHLSLSVAGGPQHYRVNETSVPESSSWSPSIGSSIGWQGVHTTFAASYSQQVSGGGGLLGAFHSRSGVVAARWQIAPHWMAEGSGQYAINNAVTPHTLAAFQNGHSIGGTVSASWTINRQMSVNGEFDRLHESYHGVAALSSNPDSDRVSLSLSWEFMRPFGR